MDASEAAVRRRWAALVEKCPPCPHGLPQDECAPCAALRARSGRPTRRGQPIKPWCPEGHLKDKWDPKGRQLICSTCRLEATRRYRQAKSTGLQPAGVE